MAILDDVKLAVRISAGCSTYNSELTSLINACKKDLQKVGVGVVDDTDALTARAIVLYCKGYFGFRKDNEKYISAYEKLADSMAQSGFYMEVDDNA